MRRGLPTLQRQHGVPIAVNVGDAMLALTLRPLLENIGVVGLGPALRILEAVSIMVQESVHGQAVELDWVRRSIWEVEEDDYVRMVVLKTGWYSFITPMTCTTTWACPRSPSTRSSPRDRQCPWTPTCPSRSRRSSGARC